MKTLKENIMEEFKDQSQRLGLVLGGGGAKGCYEIGCLQAFKECGIHFDCVSGTSIGAIVGAVYACEKDDDFVDFVIDMKPTDIVENLVIPDNIQEAFEGREKMLKVMEHYRHHGGFDITPLMNKFDEMFDYDAFEKSDIDYACVTFNVTQLKPVYWYKNQGITRDNIQDVVISSASCFPAFPVHKIGSDLYIDGGYDDNLPVELCLNMKAEKIIAIDVKGAGLYHPKIEKDTIAYWEPMVPLSNILDFRAKEGMRSMQLGYLETMKRLDQLPGFIYTFVKEDFRKMVEFENFLQVFANRKGIELDKSIKKHFLGQEIPDLRSKYTRIFLYEIVLEYLATAVNLDPSHTYRFTEFLNELMDALHHERRGITEDFKLDDLVDDSKLEILNLLYKFDNKIPQRLRKIDFIEDFIALTTVWKGMEEYLKK